MVHYLYDACHPGPVCLDRVKLFLIVQSLQKTSSLVVVEKSALAIS
jgi:hypothetical protein